MKRMHIHVGVENLGQSIKFYSALFGAAPSREKADYAKWLLEDPHVNFAISSRSGKAGVDHLGIQVDEDSDLEGLRSRLRAADMALFDEGETVCCYARSEKSWVEDPAGIAWEAYKTMDEAEFFGSADASDEGACCVPEVSALKVDEQAEAPKGSCC